MVQSNVASCVDNPNSQSVKEADICTHGSYSRKLSTSTSDGGVQEIHQTIPDGVDVQKVSYGHGVFATRFFPRGSVVYVGEQIVIPNTYAEFRLVIDNRNNRIFNLNTETHSVQFSDSERWLYLFDSFMNHSCDPTTVSRQTPELKLLNQYETVAVRDIYPGDQITCDYNLFEYDCHGKVIEKCQCGSAACLGRIAGFRYLSPDEQQARLQVVEDEVLEAMSEDPTCHFIYVPDLRCPEDRISLVEDADQGNISMVAARSFAVGEVVYSNESLIFPEESNIVILFNGKRKWLTNLVHTVNRGDGKREFYYFDSFQNHSCDPNTKMVYLSDNQYDLVATRKISAGEEVTSDYESFDAGLDGTSFNCKCGTSVCRGVINA